METSPEINELATALSKAQSEITNTSKDATNPFYKSKYSTLAEVLTVVRMAFTPHGLAVMQHPSIEDGKVTVTTIITHSSGQWAKSSISAAAGKNIQESGSAITYCRRYALSAIAGVSQEDDDGEDAKKNGVPPKQEKQEPPKTTAAIDPKAKPMTLADYKARFDKFETCEEANKWAESYWSTKVMVDLTTEEDKKAASVYFDGVVRGLNATGA